MCNNYITADFLLRGNPRFFQCVLKFEFHNTICVFFWTACGQSYTLKPQFRVLPPQHFFRKKWVAGEKQQKLQNNNRAFLQKSNECPPWKLEPRWQGLTDCHFTPFTHRSKFSLQTPQIQNHISVHLSHPHPPSGLARPWSQQLLSSCKLKA